MKSDAKTTLYVKPGEVTTIEMACERCESYRWRAVNPYRSIRRALKRLGALDVSSLRDDQQGLVQEAIYFLSYGEHDALELSNHARADKRPQRRDSLQDQMADVWQAATLMGAHEAADWIRERVGEFDR
jgi:hypothetical protein